MFYLKWIWSHIATIRGGFAIAILFMLIETGSNIVMTYLQKYIIDDVFIQGEYHLLPEYLIWFALSFLGASAFYTIAAYRYVYNEYVMDDILLLRMLRRFFRIPMSRIQNERTARYVQYITGDLHMGGSMIGYHSPNGVQRLLNVALLMGIVGWHSPFLLLTVTISSLAYIAGSHYFAKRIKDIHREVEDNRTKLSVHLEESISATRETIAYHRTAWEAKIYQMLYQNYFNSVMKETREINRQTVFIDPLRWIVTLAILGFGGYQLFTGSLTLGAFVIVFQFTNQLMESFQRLFRYIMDLSGMLANIDRMELLMTEEQVDPGTLPLHEPVQSIRFDEVGFAYDTNDRTVLQKVSFEIPSGLKVAFVGASGGGKSTIAQLLVRFYDPTEGQIIVNGKPLQDIRLEDWNRRVRIVFQDPYMMADTLNTNLAFGRDGMGEAAIEEACRSAQLYDDIARLPKRFEEEIGERGVQLSGGQKQRLALARAILDDPEILVLDEATSSLDLETERRLQERLDRLRAGKTTIIIAHRLSTVRNADLIFVMDKGRVVEQGTHDELMADGLVYPSLLMAQSQAAAG
ncbi:ABC transporter ATP-binding protein/permease [Paenibacillus oenotherae]|uniref:ABC transporter ATP-binding protein/permease n=1 Tax=Paenibacillus oenotherae TaxID=1435645 RepID=A0ABS7D9B9_9BACL|nr:ABC transporter ATP-binding protein [Paenibacillus oenotherae]MBW7476353.1 ABC transporter ATP-binding protein/permease [Paenibacillus oenotherae]